MGGAPGWRGWYPAPSADLRLGRHREFRIKVSCALLVAMVAMVAGPAWAANLDGVVTYRTSDMPRPQGLAGALITVYHTATGGRTITRSNNVGMYLLKNIPEGLYVIVVEKDGRRIYQGKVQIRGAETRFDIGL